MERVDANALLAEIATRSRASSAGLPRPRRRAARPVPDANKADPRARRARPDRRRPRLPRGRAGRHVPQPEPRTRTSPGEWISETEVIETAAELVELYNPADIYRRSPRRRARGRHARRADRRRGPSRTAACADEAVGTRDPYAAAADSWAAGQPAVRRGSRRAQRGARRCTSWRSTSRSAASAPRAA